MIVGVTIFNYYGPSGPLKTSLWLTQFNSQTEGLKYIEAFVMSCISTLKGIDPQFKVPTTSN